MTEPSPSAPTQNTAMTHGERLAERSAKALVLKRAEVREIVKARVLEAMTEAADRGLLVVEVKLHTPMKTSMGDYFEDPRDVALDVYFEAEHIIVERGGHCTGGSCYCKEPAETDHYMYRVLWDQYYFNK
jgi:hypothetical protein